MKKIKVFFEAFLNAIVNKGTSFIAPLVFAIILATAINQSFFVGLMMITVSLAFQLILSKFFRKEFGWVNNLKRNTPNILFNLIKILTILGYPYLIYVNYADKLHPLGTNGLTLAGSICVLVSGAFLLESTNDKVYHFQALIRGVSAIFTLTTLILFMYLTFGTLLNLIVFLAIIFFTFFRCQSEIIEAFEAKAPNFLILIITGAFLTAFVSLVVYCWHVIISPFIALWDLIIETSPYLTVWGIILIIFVVVIFIYLIILAKTKIKDWKSNREEIKEQQAKREEIEKEAEEQRKNDLDRLRDLSKRDNDYINHEDLLFIVSFYKSMHVKISGSKCVSIFGIDFSVKKLTSIKLEKFINVSMVKQQITWQNNFEDIFPFFKKIYQTNFNDNDLTLIVEFFKDFSDFLTNIKEREKFSGYSLLMQVIKELGLPYNRVKP